jgi:hypothetical protein
MHHRKGRDYQAANVGWLWKQQHVYTGGQNDNNFTGVKEINRFGDSRAVGLVTDRYRFVWRVLPRLNLPSARYLVYAARVPVNRNGTDTTLLTPALTITAHTALNLAASVINNTFGWGVTVTNQTSQLHGGHNLTFQSTAANVVSAIDPVTESVVIRI